jgi:membrane protein YdbS with pleckstrin-like domain/predicted Ser/Thr protein kinase
LTSSSAFDFVLGNRYRLLSPLGEGGMASVYVAQDERLGRRVAVKVMAESLVRDPGFVKRFQAEAEAAAKLAHPNIVAVYDVGQDAERRYIVMELVTGRNLKDIIADRGALPVGEAVAIVLQVLDGLAYAHAHGLIHRDVKPQNILVTRDGVAKLADFGIAKAVDASSATQTAAVLGSAHYLSPEQARGDTVSLETDLYSTGVVLYEMCTGSVPFDGSNLLSVASRHLNDEPQNPSRVNPSVPAALSRIILTALAKAPASRFESAASMSEALRALDVAEVESLHDLGATQAFMEPGRGQPSKPPRASEVTVTRPAVLRHILWGLLVAIAAVIILRANTFLPSTIHAWSTTALPVVAALVGALAVGFVAYGIVERMRRRYTIDEHAVTVEVGILAHHRDAIPLPAIINLQLHQSPVARIFNLGTIVLSTVQIPGQGPVTLSLRDVAHASEIYETILHRIGGGRRLRYESEPLVEDLGG